MKCIIVLSGLAKSGKDTVANYLVSNHGYTRLAFADELKEIVAKTYDISIESLHDQTLKEQPLEQYPVIPKDPYSLMLAKSLLPELRDIDGNTPMEAVVDNSGAFMGLIALNQTAQLYHTPRSLTILEGNVKRSVNANYWIDKVISKIDNTYSNIVISDLRFKQELKVLQQTYGKAIIPIRVSRFEFNPSSDISENDLTDKDFSVIIDNTSTVQNLYRQIEELLK